MEARDDADVVRVALAALVRRMSDDQINRVIGELEYLADEHGGRNGDNPHAQAARQLIATLESRRERRNGNGNGQSVPPPSLSDAAAAGHEA
jgi:hypothetical protein